jgi:hypothetical protein
MHLAMLGSVASRRPREANVLQTQKRRVRFTGGLPSVTCVATPSTVVMVAAIDRLPTSLRPSSGHRKGFVEVLILASASRDPSPCLPARPASLRKNTSRWASNRKKRMQNGEAIRERKTRPRDQSRRRQALVEGPQSPSSIGSSWHRSTARHGHKDRETSRPNTARVSCLLLFALSLRRDGDGTEVGRDQRGRGGGNMQKPAQAPRFFPSVRRTSSKLPRANRSMRQPLHA